MKRDIYFEKLGKIMDWEKFNGETWEDVFIREVGDVTLIPDNIIIDVVYEGNLERWAMKQNHKSVESLSKEILSIMRKAVNSHQLNGKKKDTFPSLRNFAKYCNRVDYMNGGLRMEAERIANAAWYGSLAKKHLKERTDKMFKVEPNKEKFEAIVERIKKVWGFNDKDIDSLRYFVCQTKHENHNPSMNKSIYLWSEEKQTGKTTIARAIVSVLNGEENMDNAGKYESTLAKEMQYNVHDIPMAASCNAVILDESMPKDTSKAYGQIKQMLTSNSCQFNQKFREIITLSTKRFYFCTSNENISEFIQDRIERRFCSIRLERTPLQLSFEEIYEIWKEFCVNATPRFDDWQMWYNSIDHVTGLATEEINYYINKFRDDPVILQTIYNAEGTYITPPVIADVAVKGKATTKERKAVIGALDKLVGAPPENRKSKYKRSELIEAILNLKKEDEFEEESEKTKEELIDDLPF